MRPRRPPRHSSAPPGPAPLAVHGWLGSQGAAQPNSQMWHVIDVGRLVYIRYAPDPAADSAGLREIRAALPPPAPAPLSWGPFWLLAALPFFKKKLFWREEKERWWSW